MGEPSQRLPEDDAATLPDTVLRDADTDRARHAYWIAAVACGVGAGSLRLVDGPAALGWSTSAVMVVAGLVCALIAWQHRDGGLFSHREATLLGIMLCAAALSACAHFGPFSAAAVGLVLLVIGIAMGDVKRGRIFFAIIVLGYCAVAALAVFGVIPPINPAAHTGDRVVLLGGGLAVAAVIAVSYWYGRAARRTTADAIASLHKARVAIAGRDALLHEVQADLDRMREGRHGRMTGKRLDSYQLFELIGRGGNGEVYRGHDSGSGTGVAVKVLHPHLVAEDTQVDRFFREARVAASLASAHVVNVRELGVGPEGAPFIVMELLEGRTLTEVLRGQGSMSLDDAEVLVSHVAAGLSVAHDAGIVHRDIKPGNLVLVEEEGESVWKVVDFGISKLMEGSGTLTRGALIGTPGYMAPEQAAGEEGLDGRADIFALGAVLYRVLTGRPPFSGPDPLAVALDTVRRQPFRPGSLRRLPSDVDCVVALALAKEAKVRFATANELAESFSLARRGELDDAIRRRAHDYLARMPWTEEPLIIEDAPESATLRMGVE